MTRGSFMRFFNGTDSGEMVATRLTGVSDRVSIKRRVGLAIVSSLFSSFLYHLVKIVLESS
jgi:hypothetical protein